MVARGSVEKPQNGQKWSLRSSFGVLGHILDDNGSTASCWEKTRRAMWRAYFANCRKCANKSCAMQLLQRAVTPVFDYRNTRWPAHADLSQSIDRVQRKMVAGIMRTQMLSGESAESFVRQMMFWPMRHACVWGLGATVPAIACYAGATTLNAQPTLRLGRPCCFTTTASIGSWSNDPSTAVDYLADALGQEWPAATSAPAGTTACRSQIRVEEDSTPEHD